MTVLYSRKKEFHWEEYSILIRIFLLSNIIYEIYVFVRFSQEIAFCHNIVSESGDEFLK